MYELTESGVEKSIETWKIVVPLHDNDKKSFPRRLIESVSSKRLAARVRRCVWARNRVIPEPLGEF